MKKRLCNDIEKSVGREMHTPSDFELLRERIYNRLHVLISSTTLKRIWGYLNDGVETRRGTFDILARFLGFRDYNHYEKEIDTYQDEIQSCPVLSRKLNVVEELIPGDKVRILWLPDRCCEVIYLGNQQFKVLHSCHTRIQPEDTFSCSLFIEGEPLFIDNLVQDNRAPVAYVCGKKLGIRFEKIS